MEEGETKFFDNAYGSSNQCGCRSFLKVKLIRVDDSLGEQVELVSQRLMY